MTGEELRVELPGGVTAREARLQLALRLYQQDLISLGKAAELAGYPKRSFIDMLGQNQIPVLKYSPEDLRRELADHELFALAGEDKAE